MSRAGVRLTLRGAVRAQARSQHFLAAFSSRRPRHRAMSDRATIEGRPSGARCAVRRGPVPSGGAGWRAYVPEPEGGHSAPGQDFDVNDALRKSLTRKDSGRVRALRCPGRPAARSTTLAADCRSVPVARASRGEPCVGMRSAGACAGWRTCRFDIVAGYAGSVATEPFQAHSDSEPYRALGMAHNPQLCQPKGRAEARSALQRFFHIGAARLSGGAVSAVRAGLRHGEPSACPRGAVVTARHPSSARSPQCTVGRPLHQAVHGWRCATRAFCVVHGHRWAGGF